MNKRFLWVAGATALAAAVFVLAAWLGGPGPVTSAGPGPTPPDVTGHGISAEDRDNPDNGVDRPIEVVENLEFFSDDGETITRFTGKEFTPQADFIADVTEPAAEVRFSPSKVLLITAASGRFHHPGNVPTRGEFHADTVVTQYEAPDGVPADLASDEHVQFRLYLDGLATFDRQDGHIQSDGPVRLVAPDLDFTGTGLDLTFNDLEDRIEQLTIAHGEELRLARDSEFAPGSAPGSAPAPGSNPEDIPKPRTERSEVADQGSGTSVPVSPDNTDETDADPQPVQHYRAVLHDDIQITVGPDEAELAGDRLEVVFALKPGSEPAATTRRDTDGPFYFVNDAPAAAAAPVRGLMPAAADDIVVRWSGRLEMNPLPASAEHQLEADDAVFALHGSPARIDTVRDEHITAAVVGFRTTDERVYADGSADHPLLVQAPDLGDLTGTRLAVNQLDGTGQLLGPGRLVTENQELDVAFADRLDLTFAPDADGRLDMIESATFVGDVKAKTNSDDPEQQLDIASRTLTLTVTRDEHGDPQPSHLQASGTADQPVIALQPGTKFRAEQLDVDLAPAPGNPPENTPKPRTERSEVADRGAGTSVPVSKTDRSKDFQITRLRALRGVFVQRPDEELTLTAHALDADPRTNRLELFGRGDDSFATLTRGEDSLAGVHLVLLEDEKSADAIGPGRFSARVDEDDPTARLNVTWRESMAFNNAEGTALFVGSVDSASTSATDDTSLSAHSLALEFVPQDLDDENTDEAPPPDNPQAPDLKPQTSILDLRRAHALADPENPEDQVVFTAQTFDAVEGAPEQPLTRSRLWSRELIFYNQPPNLTNATTIDDNITVERVSIPGRGRMLLEDYRSDPQSENENAAEAGIDFVGRGATLFDWGKQLTLDLQTDELRIEGEGELDVKMVHDPDPTNDDPEEYIKLNAQVLVANLAETGGLGAFVDGAEPDLRIETVIADGRIKVSQGTTNIVADHMEYDEALRRVKFWAEPRREAQLTLDGNTTTAQTYYWDLATDTFTAENPGTGVIPVE